MSKVNIKNSSLRDVAGGSIHKPTYNFNGSASPLTDLLTKLAEGEDEETVGFINKLNHFISESNKGEAKFIGLNKKLSASGAQPEYISYAAELKEDFSKLLEENSTNLHTQEIYASLMASIRSKFMHHVQPHLHTKQCHEVLGLVEEKVIIPTLSIVVPNPLQITDETISGMLFYLTGNCHVGWGNAGL